MDLGRYIFPDEYILEELRRDYQHTDTKGRILLLRKLCRDDQHAPCEIALLAVEDPNVEVRQWIARHGKYLDYRKDQEDSDQDPNRNLEDRLVAAPMRVMGLAAACRFPNEQRVLNRASWSARHGSRRL
jgi:hypothetical protein